MTPFKFHRPILNITHHIIILMRHENRPGTPRASLEWVVEAVAVVEGGV